MSENKTYGNFTTLLLLNLVVIVGIGVTAYFTRQYANETNHKLGKLASHSAVALDNWKKNHDTFEEQMTIINESINDLQMDIFYLRWRIIIHDIYMDVSKAMHEHQEKQKRELSSKIKTQKEQEQFENMRLSKLRLKSVVIDPNSEYFVSVTAYNMGPLTAMGTQVRCGVIAASKDLIDVWGYGCTLVVYTKDSSGNVSKFGEYVLEDRMHDRWSKKCDIYMSTRDKCMEFGIRKMWVAKKMD